MTTIDAYRGWQDDLYQLDATLNLRLGGVSAPANVPVCFVRRHPSSLHMRLVFLVLAALLSGHVSAASTCFGTTSAGRLESACNLPRTGKNFSTYSSILRAAGRTYLHCDVHKVMLDAYSSLETSNPDTVYVFGETGKKQGGLFNPHKTHQNGLSVDFMIPVVDRNGASVPLPTSIINKYGYDIDFTVDGKYKNLTIDYEAFASHLAALGESAKRNGVGIWRVIFDPKMQHELKTTKAWPLISHLTFSTRRSWVRHDDHYHVDFDVPCKPL
mgnify:CR=1 FL=1